MKRQCNDDGFSYLEKPVMKLLAKPRTKHSTRELIKLLHSIFDYYIKFFLFKYRIFKNHAEYPDLYGDAYLFACELLSKVRSEGNNFNRIKRYINKSLGGWLTNKICKKKKKCVELTKDDLTIALQVDYQDDYAEIDHKTDLSRIRKHVKMEMDFYMELYNALYGSESFERREELKKKFYDAAFVEYFKDGRLLEAIEFFEHKYGSVFTDESDTAEATECCIRA